MIREIVSVNVKSCLNDLVYLKHSGIRREYIKVNHPKKKIEKIIFFSSKLKENKINVFIQVKFKYLRREKRIEIVTIKDKLISLFKISNNKTLDKDAIEIDQLLSNIKNEFKKTDFQFIGNIIHNRIESKLVINSVKNNLLNKVNFMCEKDYN